MSEPSPERTTAPAPALIVAFVVVLVGTFLFDASRIWLLSIPLSGWFACYAAGQLAEAFLGPVLPDGGPALTRLALRMSVGLACLSMAAVLSALSGFFWIAGIIAALCCLAGIVALARWVLTMDRRELLSISGGSGLVLGVVALVGWLWATIPPIFYDELAYHLVVPDQTLATGSLPAYPWNFFNMMPHVSDVTLAWGMFFGGGIGARAMHWSVWLICILSAWGLVEAITWPKPAPWAGALTAAILATSPTFWFLGVLTFAEASLTFAVIGAATIALLVPSERSSWWALGLLLGFVCTVKLPGLTWAAAGLATVAMLGWSWRAVASAASVMCLSATPWWARAFLHTGNPIYPVGYRFFGGNLWSEASRSRAQGDLPPTAFDLGVEGLLRLPFDLVRYPERYASAGDVGFLAVAAVLLVLFLPVAKYIVRGAASRLKQGNAAALFIFLAAVAWALTSTTSRFFAPGFVLCLAITLGLAYRYGRVAIIVVSCLITPLSFWETSRFLSQHHAAFASTQIALGRMQADSYLKQRLSYYQAAGFADEHLPSAARVLFIGEFRSYYFGRVPLAPSPYDHHPLGDWVQEAHSAEDLVHRLKGEGITHVVLNIPEFRRLHEQYGVLAFTGEQAATWDQRLRELPRHLDTLFSASGVYVFAVP